MGTPDRAFLVKARYERRVWMRVWTRAVIAPAFRRVGATWIACAIVASQLFGGIAMKPRDITHLAISHAPVMAVLVAIWLLVFLPTARVVVRQEGARFLRSLPGPRVAPLVVASLALVALQLPWLALWLVGDHARGLLVVLIVTAGIAGLAALRMPTRIPTVPVWGSAIRGLVGVHVRALARRAGDALVRGLGLAVLAGATAALFVHNNQLEGRDAAVLGSAVIAIVLVPAQTGPLSVLLDSHRATEWVARSMGVREAVRVGALALVVGGVYVLGTLIGLAAVIPIARLGPWFVGVALGVALGSAAAVTRVLVGAGETTRVTVRAAVGSFAVACACVVTLGLLGVSGVLAVLGGGLAWLGAAR